MEDKYRKIFWGFIITIFNINLGPINILPDFLGYLFIGAGLGNILDEFENNNIKIAKKTANFLAFYSIGTYIIFMIILGGQYQYKGIVENGVSVLGSSIGLVMAFHIVSGTIDLYISRGYLDFVDSLRKSQRNYCMLYIIGLLLISVSINFFNNFLSIVSVACLFIAQIYFATIISRIKNTFSEELI